MGAVRVCQWCEKELEGRQTKWCSESCRMEAFRVSRAGYYLSCLPQKDFRAAIKEACEARWPGRYDRLLVRFGDPSMPDGRPGLRS